MVNHTRLDCVLGSTALMRRAVAEATHHTAHRAAFGRLLADQPLMQNVLADLCVESEAATVTALRLARAYDEADGPFRRIATAVAKFWICKRTPPLVAEALECLGGNGFVEESQLPRFYRESPLNSIWEGSGNVNALDVLRALGREPETAEAFLAEVRLGSGADARLDAAIGRLERELAEPEEQGARRLLETLATALQGSLLVRHGAPEVADAFCASRLESRGGIFGTLPAGLDLAAIAERHRPRLAG
jgi:putative acyl-CoA dehydrogenase